MPRKTRKEKERAKLRQERKVSLASETPTTSPVNREITFSLDSFKKRDFEPGHAKKVEKSSSYPTVGFVASDLVRSVLLAVGIVSLELVLYWLWFK